MEWSDRPRNRPIRREASDLQKRTKENSKEKERSFQQMVSEPDARAHTHTHANSPFKKVSPIWITHLDVKVQTVKRPEKTREKT